jgi:NAD+ diphosphatase
VSPVSRGDRPGFAFAADGLDRAADRRDDEDWLAQAWSTGGRAVAVDPHGRVLATADGSMLVPLDASDLGERPGQRRLGGFLGLLEGSAWFAARVDPSSAPWRTGTAFADLRSLAPLLPAGAASLAAYARALLHWQSRKRYCGVCGAATSLGSAGHKASCSDAGCGTVYFPRTDPAIIVVVTDGPRCLLGRQPSWPERRYSTLAGFVEPGETLEAAVAREVREESGIAVERVCFVASQPWPFPASLMVGFEADAARPAGPVVIGDELADARWFGVRELIDGAASGDLLLPPETSISYHLIAGWCERLGGERPKPGPVLIAPR